MAFIRKYLWLQVGAGAASINYVGTQDAMTLSRARAYALQDAKGYADGVGPATLAAANSAISTAQLIGEVN